MFRIVVFCLTVSSLWALPSSARNRRPVPIKRTGPRIINGNVAEEGQFPWQVGIYTVADDGFWFCGGSIISEEWILTAGHCVEGVISAEVVTGTLNPYEGQTTNASEFILHEGYDAYASANDIGLMKLVEPLKFDDNTAAITLSTEELEIGVDMTVSGWGLTSDDAAGETDTLNYVEVRTIPASVCEQYYAVGAILPEMVCANSSSPAEVRGTCDGDSGSAGVLYVDSKPVQVAIVCFISNQGCESGYPSGYMRSAYYRDWIREKTGI